MVILFDSTPNQPSKSRRKNWVEVNHDSRWTNNTNSQIEIKTTTLSTDYSDT